MKLFELLDKAAENRTVEVEWYYHEEDDTMEEFGEEFAEDMENSLFKLISYNEDWSESHKHELSQVKCKDSFFTK